ncbi:MAG: UTP--glucose-1-phosphate uridylyltransferase [Kiritimatiellae bacterium]|jgi:UTP--glucose-1-phosphate uridylyltransferase|nr:UTP--glucose-1-phosphate uridylyltransferase [Kiritimatiellia bacterium]
MKAIIPAAGHGTRFFPASKVIPKELLPVGRKPAIQWIVEEALEAGVDEVIIVTSPEKSLLRRYFTEEPIWYERLQNKAEAKAALEEVDLLSKRIRFVEQAEQLGLGHAVLQAAPLLKGEDEPILILLGDALVLSSTPCACEMAEISRENNGASVVGLEQVPDEKVSRYGIVAGKKLENPNVLKLTGLIEKPSLEEAPSNLAIAGRYLLHPRIFKLLENTHAGHGGEIQLTDAISSLLQEIPVLGFQYPGKRYDIGNPQGYLETLNAFAGSKS